MPTDAAAPPPAALLDVAPLQSHLREFARERDWERFHAPKNLVMALTAEVGELVELFQWETPQASYSLGQDPATAQAVRDELADVLMHLVRLADVMQVDLNAAVGEKLLRNAQKYPRLPDPA